MKKGCKYALKVVLSELEHERYKKIVDETNFGRIRAGYATLSVAAHARQALLHEFQEVEEMDLEGAERDVWCLVKLSPSERDMFERTRVKPMNDVRIAEGMTPLSVGEVLQQIFYDLLLSDEGVTPAEQQVLAEREHEAWVAHREERSELLQRVHSLQAENRLLRSKA